MRGLRWPATGADYYVHGYLDSNPFAAEYDIAAQQRAELRDPELREAVRRRDRDRCRYCAIVTIAHDRRSRCGRVFDHVDPGQAAGAANLVTSCRECNSRKGRRTPAAAGLTLLPVPGDGVVVGDADLMPATDQDAADLEPTYDDNNDTDLTDTRRRDTDVPGRDGTGRVHAPRPRNGAGWAGPAGERHPTGPAPPRRSSVHPDPYRRAGITGPDPADHAGLPGDDLHGDLPP
jgi:hypothetical protein